MHKALASEDWTTLQGQLAEFVTNFRMKVIRASGGFQM
jgi:hypothetical protein